MLIWIWDENVVLKEFNAVCMPVCSFMVAGVGGIQEVLTPGVENVSGKRGWRDNELPILQLAFVACLRCAVRNDHFLGLSWQLPSISCRIDVLVSFAREWVGTPNAIGSWCDWWLGQIDVTSFVSNGHSSYRVHLWRILEEIDVNGVYPYCLASGVKVKV